MSEYQLLSSFASFLLKSILYSNFWVESQKYWKPLNIKRTYFDVCSSVTRFQQAVFAYLGKARSKYLLYWWFLASVSQPLKHHAHHQSTLSNIRKHSSTSLLMDRTHLRTPVHFKFCYLFNITFWNFLQLHTKSKITINFCL